MLAIRLQRTGRKGHAQFRIVVQDSRFTPTSGRIVAQLGNYNPHSKAIKLDKENAQKYLDNGAQPSDRVVLLLKKEGVKLPKWVKEPTKKQRTVRNPEKLQKDAPPADQTTEESSDEATDTEAPKQEEPAEEVADESQPADQPAEDAPANESSADEPAAE